MCLLLISFFIVSHFHSITGSSTHTTAETSSYNQDFIHHFCNYCNFNHPWLPQQKPAYEEVKASTHLLEHPLKNVIEPHPVISWDSAATQASLWHRFYVLFFFSTTISAACRLSAVSLERSLSWKTSNLMANCNKTKLALTVPLGSIHLRPCCFVKRDVATSGPSAIASAISEKGQQFAIHLISSEMLASLNWLPAWHNIGSKFPLISSTAQLEKHRSRENKHKRNTCPQKCLEFLHGS